MTNNHRQFFSRSFILLIIIVVVGVFITLFAWYNVNDNIRRQAELSFEAQTQLISGMIATRFSRDITIMDGLRGLYDVAPQATRFQFYDYVDKYNIAVAYPNVAGINHWSVVKAGEQAVFEKQVRADTSVRPQGYADFKIFPAAPNQEQYVLDYVFPEEANIKALGYDVLSDPTRRQLAEAARDGGQPLISKKIFLLPNNEPGVIMVGPLYTGGLVPDTVEARRQKLTGFVTVTIKLDSFLQDITKTGQINWQKFIFRVYSAPQADANDENLAFASNNAYGFDKSSFVKEVPLKIGNSNWTIDYRGDSDYDVSPIEAIVPWITLIGGLLLTFAIATAFSVLATSRLRALKLAESMTKDLRASKQQAESLAKDLEKFKLAVEGAADHIIITDSEGVVLYVNKGATTITGFSAKEILGKKVGSKDLWGGEMPKDFYEKMWHTIKTDKKNFTGEINNHRKNGQKYVAMSSITPILDKKGEVEFFVGIERDISKEKEIDKAKTEFVSLASHQLRTPLSAIKWSSEMLLGDDEPISEHQSNYLKQIYTSNERMIDLVNALLNVARLDAGTLEVKIEQIDLRALSQSLLTELAPAIKTANLQVVTAYDDKLPTLSADAALIRIIVQNLLTNAIKYTPAGGHIDLSVKKEPKSILISVKDTGYGIPLDAQDKIFTKMFRADNVKEKDTDGNGLGLYLAKSLVENAGGKIWFESVVDKGTTFYVRLPLTGMKPKTGTKHMI